MSFCLFEVGYDRIAAVFSGSDLTPSELKNETQIFDSVLKKMTFKRM